MSRHTSAARRRGDERETSPAVSRIMILGFLVAAILGLVTGLIWVAWNLIRRWFGA